MVVGDARGKSETTANQKVTHDRLEACLSTLEIRTRDQAAILLGIFDDSWMEGVLRRAVQVQALLLDSGYAVEHRGR